MYGKIILFLACVCVVIGSVQSVQAADPVTVKVITGEWEPYTGEKMQGYGVANEVVSYAFLEAGVEPAFTFMPWARIAKMIESGEAVCSTLWYSTEERENWALFSDPVYTSESPFFYMKEKMGNWDFASLEDVKGLRVGGIQGYYYDEMYKEAGVKADYSTSLDSLVKKLYMDRIDIFSDDKLVGWHMIKKLYPNEMHKFDSSITSLKDGTMHLMFSKAHPDSEELLQKFNEGLKRIKEKGIYDKIMAKYL